MLSQVCHKCNKPYEDLGYCCEAERDGPSIDLDSHYKTGNIQQFNANEHELNFVESKKEDWVDLGAHYRHSFMGYKMDVYRVLEIFKVTCPVAQHIIKKLLRGEGKGHTMDFVWNEVKQAVERKFEMMEEDNNEHKTNKR